MNNALGLRHYNEKKLYKKKKYVKAHYSLKKQDSSEFIIHYLTSI